MSVLKKTSLMAAGAVLLFFLLAYIDEFENLFLSPDKSSQVSVDPYEIESVLKGYVAGLSAAYLDPDSSDVSGLPMSETLISELQEEIQFLKNDSRIVEYSFKNLWLQNVNQVAADKVRASTREVLAVRYLAYPGREEIRAVPDAIFNMSYVLQFVDNGWIVIRYDEMGIKKVEESR